MGIVILRLLALGLLVWVGYKLIRKFITPPSQASAKEQFEAMVSCSHCGLHLPQNESILKNGRHYCCTEHAEADPKP